MPTDLIHRIDIAASAARPVADMIKIRRPIFSGNLSELKNNSFRIAELALRLPGRPLKFNG